MIQTRLLLAAALVAPTLTPLALDAQQAFDRTRPPALATAPALTVPAVKSVRLDNGAALRVVEQHELPLVHITLQLAGGGRRAAHRRR